MKKYNIFLKLIVLLSFNVYSQKSSFLDIKTQNPKSTVKTISNFNPSTFTGGYFNKESSSINKIENKEILGSFYLFKEWNNDCKIVTFTEKTYNINNLNFDLEDGKFLSKISNDSVYVYKRLKEIYVNKKKFINIDNKYFEVLFSGKTISLLKEHYGKLKPAVTNKMTNQLIKAPEYVAKFRYYLKDEKNLVIKELFMKKKSIIKLLNDKKDKITTYAKNENLSFKDINDFIKILNYYNSQ